MMKVELNLQAASREAPMLLDNNNNNNNNNNKSIEEVRSLVLAGLMFTGCNNHVCHLYYAPMTDLTKIGVICQEVVIKNKRFKRLNGKVWKYAFMTTANLDISMRRSSF